MTQEISIHAPHARSDLEFHCLALVPYYFNPRSSCEERHDVDAISADIVEFQSTLLMRGATEVVLLDVLIPLFQSTLLMRGATAWTRMATSSTQFQSTLLMRGATRLLNLSGEDVLNFNPRSSCEERQGATTFTDNIT